MRSNATYFTSSFLSASTISVCETMAYRSNTLRLGQPAIFMMTPSAIPAPVTRRFPIWRKGCVCHG